MPTHGPLQDTVCSRVLRKRGTMVEGVRLTDDELCPRTGVTDVIVSFNGLRYVVPLCGEHKAQHDTAAAARRSSKSGATRRERDQRTHDRRVAVARGLTP